MLNRNTPLNSSRRGPNRLQKRPNVLRQAPLPGCFFPEGQQLRHLGRAQSERGATTPSESQEPTSLAPANLRSRNASHGTPGSLLSTLLLVFALAACGDDTVKAVGGGPLPDGGQAVDTMQDTFVPPQGSGREIIVLHDTSLSLQVGVTSNQELKVKVIDYASSGPAREALVGFSIVGNPGGGDASLSSNQAYTDNNGEASVTFRSKTSADVSYTIEVASQNAAPVRFDVFVADSPRGDLRVALQYEGPVAVKNVHVRLLDGNFTCGQFNPVNPPGNVIAEQTLLGVGQQDIIWQNLPENERFTVVATAQSQRGTLAAAGCLDGVVILGGQENKVTLTMFLLVLNPTGVYDSLSVFDFTGAIPGQVGEIVTELSTLFTSPGTFLIDQVKKLAAIYVGQLITDVVFGLFEDTVADVIDNWMFNNSPQWVQDILVVGQDLFQIVNKLEMLATLQISKLSNDYYVQGALLWDGLALYWRLGCAPQGQPDYDPLCGRNEFSLADFSNTQFPLNIIEGRFTALIQDFDQLDIDNHVIKLNYGKLIIFVLNEMILPALTGEHTLTDAVLSFVNCESIGDAVGSFSVLGITEQTVENFCTSAVGLITNPIELILANLALDSQLRMQGHATLVDDNSDLLVDRTENGTFVGHFESDGQQGNQFTGTWSAVRRTNP